MLRTPFPALRPSRHRGPSAAWATSALGPTCSSPCPPCLQREPGGWEDTPEMQTRCPRAVGGPATPPPAPSRAGLGRRCWPYQAAGWRAERRACGALLAETSSASPAGATQVNGRLLRWSSVLTCLVLPRVAFGDLSSPPSGGLPSPSRLLPHTRLWTERAAPCPAPA